MNVGVLTIDIRIPLSHSLKSKRRLTRSFKAKLRSKFNISVAEIDNRDLWQRATFSIALVGSNKRVLNSALSKINNYIINELKLEVINHQIEII